MFYTVIQVQPTLPLFQELKTKLLQHETQVLGETSTDISHHVLYSSVPARQPDLGCGQIDSVGKDILPTPSPMGGGRRRSTPTYYICNKKGHIKANCWFNPINRGKPGQQPPRKHGTAISSPGSHPVLFLGQQATPSTFQLQENMPQHPIAGQSGPSSTTDIQNLLMTALSQMNNKQNDAGQWYVDSGVVAHVTGNAGKFLNLTPYKGYDVVVTGDDTHHPISHENTYVPLTRSPLALNEVFLSPRMSKWQIS